MSLQHWCSHEPKTPRLCSSKNPHSLPCSVQAAQRSCTAQSPSLQVRLMAHVTRKSTVGNKAIVCVGFDIARVEDRRAREVGLHRRRPRKALRRATAANEVPKGVCPGCAFLSVPKTDLLLQLSLHQEQCITRTDPVRAGTAQILIQRGAPCIVSAQRRLLTWTSRAS